jgi:tRNA1(Val) A37 N6-methylase TrmN6
VLENLIKPNETLDDLQNGYFLIQKKEGFRFGVDAVLLSDFAALKTTDKVLEMGTGTGIIAILLYAKKKPKNITAIEIQEEMAEMANRSVIYNKLEGHITIIAMDLNDAPKKLGKAVFNAVVTNPPYMKAGCGIVNPSQQQAISRFEISCTLEDILDSAYEVLIPGGRFFMVHRADRLVDIIYNMRIRKIEPKRIRFVHSHIGKKPHLILIEGLKGGKPELKFMEPLYIYDEKGQYTKEINDIYGRIK